MKWFIERPRGLDFKGRYFRWYFCLLDDEEESRWGIWWDRKSYFSLNFDLGRFFMAIQWWGTKQRIFKQVKP